MKYLIESERRTLVCRGYFRGAGLWLVASDRLEYSGLSRRYRPTSQFRSDLIVRVAANGQMLVASTTVVVSSPAPALLGVLLFTDMDRRPQFYFSDQPLKQETVADIFRAAPNLPAVLVGDRLYLNSRVADHYPATVMSIREQLPPEAVATVVASEGRPPSGPPPERVMQITKNLPSLFSHPLDS